MNYIKIYFRFVIIYMKGKLSQGKKNKAQKDFSLRA